MNWISRTGPGLSLAIVLSILLTAQSQAQTSYKYVRKHLERYDEKEIHYGFFFAAPVTRFSVTYSPEFMTADSAYRIHSPNKPAFRVGGIINLFLDDRFDLRFTPSVSLFSREVHYDYPGGTSKTETRESTWVDFPLLLKYKSERRNNTRMYLLAGGTFSIESNVRRKELQGASRLSTGTMDFAIEYGIGLEQFFEYFKLAPELRFSHGLVNLFNPTNNAAGVGISKLTTHSVTLFLNFE
ncbi:MULTISPECIES: porin family protein [unclassified Spirosoma]|uniref:type IX secretion/gliding motility protein PorT/SprT n=1 Tax=unclassified Spirosoma TaxID=2621999 RepID=UPI00095DB101|nr:MULTISPECIES: porin family protein [unclassified Spirosoma]MBN8826786.1 PorT family protein [Spirosoma sp.]OJW73639.1 MAG: PorT [Spirosoma sp. 48-14]